ncbi:VOC family protein [Streptomyces sp. NPDC014735]|uniref:VOC family protein n=1 Tax=unclassified Streptomyces TaxID=2593676 RepID=UPI003701DBDA
MCPGYRRAQPRASGRHPGPRARRLRRAPELLGTGPDLRFAFKDTELAAIGDFLVIAGPPAERARYTHASATVIVDDLDEVTTALLGAGAAITTPESTGPTGRFLYARHPGGPEIEYVE